MQLNYGNLIEKVTSFDDPCYKILCTDGDEEEVTRASVLTWSIRMQSWDYVKGYHYGMRYRRSDLLCRLICSNGGNSHENRSDYKRCIHDLFVEY